MPKVDVHGRTQALVLHSDILHDKAGQKLFFFFFFLGGGTFDILFFFFFFFLNF